MRRTIKRRTNRSNPSKARPERDRPTRRRSSEPRSRKQHQSQTELIITEIDRDLGDSSVTAVYEKRVLTQRVRWFDLGDPLRGACVDILHTLLGIELKIGRRRHLCPDLATARYLSVFARLGCGVVSVPYDITQISRLADELESGLQRMLLLADHLTEERGPKYRAHIIRRLVERAREIINERGGGGEHAAFEGIAAARTRTRSIR